MMSHANLIIMMSDKIQHYLMRSTLRIMLEHTKVVGVFSVGRIER
jgi:hypothetical protein